MKRIVITGEKGGTGKSTISALLLEYLNFINKKAILTDLDPLQVTSRYVLNCRELNREVIETKTEADYQIIDTAGVVGASLNYIYQADLILVPFRPHYPDLLAIIPWFRTLAEDIRAKVVFLPNFWRNTKEQRQGLEQIVKALANNKGKLIRPIPDKPALLGVILNGSKDNFFNSSASAELITNLEQIFN